MEVMSPYAKPADIEKFLYKLVLQLLIFSQGSHKLLEPHLVTIGGKLRNGANLNDLVGDLHSVSKTLLHISKTKQDVKPETQTYPAAQDDYLLNRLDELLAESEVPLRFQQHTTSLRQRIRERDGEQSYRKVIDSAFSLLLNVRDFTVSEQSGVDAFLSDLSNQLIEIEQQAEIASEANRLSIDSRDSLNHSIQRQVHDFQDTMRSVDELSSVKSKTGEHLDRLLLQLLEHKQQEDARQQEAQLKIETMALKLMELESETESLRTKLKIEHDRALGDPLTGLPNRAAYNNRAEMEQNRWRRYRSPLSLVIWDIDYFKRINDTYGHKAGDKTLTLVGQLLANNCRETDFVARYGGEEFVMLMPNTSALQALEVAEHLRKMIQGCGFNSNGEQIDLTLSCGISAFDNDDTHDDVFVRADKALYHSKRVGRNRCTVYAAEIDH